MTRAWHLLRNLVPEDTNELYDLTRDIDENHDLSGLGDPIEAALTQKLGAITDAIAIPRDFAAHLKDAISKTATTPQHDVVDERVLCQSDRKIVGPCVGWQRCRWNGMERLQT